MCELPVRHIECCKSTWLSNPPNTGMFRRRHDTAAYDEPNLYVALHTLSVPNIPLTSSPAVLSKLALVHARDIKNQTLRDFCIALYQLFIEDERIVESIKVQNRSPRSPKCSRARFGKLAS